MERRKITIARLRSGVNYKRPLDHIIDSFCYLLNRFQTDHNEFNYGVYNVGSGKGIQVKKILTPAKLLIQKGNIEFGSAKMRKDELLKNYPNIQKVRKEFNWSSKFSIKKGLRHTIKFYEKN